MTTPTVSQAESWHDAPLRTAAAAWTHTAEVVAAQFDTFRQELSSSERWWQGAAAEAARRRAAELQAESERIGTALRAAATVAEAGAAQLTDLQTRLEEILRAARSTGYQVADDGSVAPPPQPQPTPPDSARRAAEFAVAIKFMLAAMGKADADTDAAIRAAFDRAEPPPATAAPTAPATFDGAKIVAAWPTMSQDDISRQFGQLDPAQQRMLIERYPDQVGNTDGVPWAARGAANQVSIGRAIADEQRLLARSDTEKLRDAFAGKDVPAGLDANTPEGRRLIAGMDQQSRERIERYQALTRPLVTANGTEIERTVLGFNPKQAKLIQLFGDLGKAQHVGVIVPGTETKVETAEADAQRAAHFVELSGGEAAMISYLDGPFPPNLPEAADRSYALDMAPRLVAFTEDVNRTADALQRGVDTTVIGHSYGGSIVGTAETQGLTADRVVYVASAGAGVDVHDESDWHNRNPDVVRYSMTAPGDLIELVQGAVFGEGPHGADTDLMAGVTRLDTGYNHQTGELVAGIDAHSAVLDAPSDAQDNILAVITGESTKPYEFRPLGLADPAASGLAVRAGLVAIFGIGPGLVFNSLLGR
ncbi:alpha/beta hydrolase family protein [Mycobacterium sp. MYCO198283]|uniref:alpha/beta hydrolase n=1 Tax=Mycobacterium sp. MYCO198283 TaxID=2883505 RepID=UPI001E614FB1|nr:alpha/beta hydrolase [Mycobacterium sp. MYCO198283]MCG5433408.1 alpha/beta hydrolase family protein [Mycobacterium sp. MYCO198283]